MIIVVALSLMVISAAVLSAAAEPWIITSDVTVTEPMNLDDVIVVGTATFTIRDVDEPGVHFAGNLWALDHSRIEMVDSVIQFDSRYHGQYSLVGIDDTTIVVSGCDYRVTEGVQHGLVTAGRSQLSIEDTDFGDVQLISAEDSQIDAVRLNGSFEVILQDVSTIHIEDIPRQPGQGRLWLWVEIPDGATIDWSPPLPGPVDGWSWPPDDAVGIAQHATIDRSEVLLWPMLVRSGSDLTLRDIPDEGWVVVGLYLPGSARISRLENDVFVGDRELDLGDRRLRLVNATVDTWNLYPQDDAVVEVADSVIGEVLSFGSSTTRIRHTTVDGTGGFVGSRDRSHLELVDSTLTCTVEAAGDSLLALRHSQVLPYPADPTGAYTRFAAWDDARLFADHTTVDTTPLAGGRGSIAVVWIDPRPWPAPAGSAVDLWGTIGIFGDAEAPGLTSWTITAVDGLGDVLPVANGAGNAEETALASWVAPASGGPPRLLVQLSDTAGRSLTAARDLSLPMPPRRSTHGPRRIP